MADAAGHDTVLELDARPPSTWVWLRDVLAHHDVVRALAAKDFKVRYKRARLGVLWAVALPLVQAAVMIVVFSRFARFAVEDLDYLSHVLTGMLVWSYVALTVNSATTAIVDGAGLTDKIWFPRAALVLAPVLANLIGFLVTAAVVVPVTVLRGHGGVRTLLVVPGAVLLFALVLSLCLVTSALQVWFRDVKFIVQAGLLVLLYATPVIYPLEVLGDLADVVRLNPFTGALALVRTALVGEPLDEVAVAATVVWTIALGVLGTQLHRRGDRRFVDLL